MQSLSKLILSKRSDFTIALANYYHLGQTNLEEYIIGSLRMAGGVDEVRNSMAELNVISSAAENPHMSFCGRIGQAVDSLLTFIEMQDSNQIKFGLMEPFMYGQDVFELFAPPALEDANKILTETSLRILSLRHDIILLKKDNDIKEWQFRSRMAEIVRLILKVRQRFPYQIRYNQSAKLVRDIKFEVRPREVPGRRVSLDDFIDKGLADILGRPGLATEEKSQFYRARDLLKLTLWAWKKTKFSDFQLRAFRRIVNQAFLSADTVTDGMVVAAGTGSGKTLSFFAAVLFIIILKKVIQGREGTKLIAIYPRINLAANQVNSFIEVLNHLRGLLGPGERQVTIGIDYGRIPYSRERVDVGRAKWKFSPEKGYACPFATCPSCGVGEKIYLPNKDDYSHPLTCHRCGKTFPFIYVSRKEMGQSPPDIYVATTESLNDRLMGVGYQKLFGQSDCSPEFVMLDEIHLHTSLQGMHIAALTRRLLRKIELARQVPGKVQVIGLSATIAYPQEFFADLTGIYKSRIHVEEPLPEELICTGAEYSIFVKPETKEERAVISTLIQAAMCLCHNMRQPLGGGKKYKTFGFVNSMDIKNRWAGDMADAEDPEKLALYRLRDPELILQSKALQGYFTIPSADCKQCAELPNEDCILFREGECWWPMRFGGGYAESLQINDVSSEGGQVREGDDLIIATSSLEVGYDDDTVMAVIQYQAPPGTASFVQRKGRGGRQAGTRPVMLTVLSPHRARDIFYYRNHRLLLDPTFSRLPLNPENRLIRRIHSFYATLDWLAYQAERVACSGCDSPYINAAMLSKIKEITSKEENLGQIKTYIKSIFNLSAQEVADIICDFEDGVFIKGLILLVKRFEKELSSCLYPPHLKKVMLGYVPSNFFQDINLPELMLDREGQKPTTLKIDQGLREAIPGRVAMRWRNSNPFWVPPLNCSRLISGVELIPVESFATGEYIGEIRKSSIPAKYASEFLCESSQLTIKVLRPHQIKMKDFGPRDNRYWTYRADTGEVYKRSTGRLALDAKSDAYPISFYEVDHTEFSKTNTLISRNAADRKYFGIFGHMLFNKICLGDCKKNQPIVLRKIIIGSSATLKLNDHRAEPKIYGFQEENGGVCALGYSLYTDGIRFEFHDDLWDRLEVSPQLKQQLKFNIFKYEILRLSEEIGGPNIFSLRTCADIFILFMAECILQNGLDLQGFIEGWEGCQLDDQWASVAKKYDLRPGTARQIIELATQPEMRGKIAGLLRKIFIEEGYKERLEDIFAHTLKHILKITCQTIAGAESADEIGAWARLQVNYPEFRTQDIHVFEFSMGGNGTFKSIFKMLLNSPNSFWGIFEKVLFTCSVSNREEFLKQVLSLPDSIQEEINRLIGRPGGQTLANRLRDHQELRKLFRDQLGYILTDTDIRNLREIYGTKLDLDGRVIDKINNWRLYQEVNIKFAEALRERLGRELTELEYRNWLFDELAKKSGRYGELEKLYAELEKQAAKDYDLLMQIIEERMSNTSMLYYQLFNLKIKTEAELQELIDMEEEDRISVLIEDYQINERHAKNFSETVFDMLEDLSHATIYFYYARGKAGELEDRIKACFLSSRMKEEIEKRLLISCQGACPDCLAISCDLGSPLTTQLLLHRHIVADMFERYKSSHYVLEVQDGDAPEELRAKLADMFNSGAPRAYVRYTVSQQDTVAQLISLLRVKGVPADPGHFEVSVVSSGLAKMDIPGGRNQYEVGIELGRYSNEVH